ncbi:MAG: BamA/TamA family outer membrane protein [Saprospiraceae bacterium]
MDNKLYPKPNKKFIGLFYTNQWLYTHVNPKPGKTTGLKYWLKNKVGKKPILAKEVDTEILKKVLQKTMQDQGYFHAEVSMQPIVSAYKTKFNYSIFNGGPTIIDTIYYPQSESHLDSLIRNYKKYQVKQNDIYNLADFASDRKAIAEQVRSQGYFDFDEQDLFFVIDTASVSDSIGIYLKVRAPRNDSIHRQYYIRHIDVFTSDNMGAHDSLHWQKEFEYRGLHINHDEEFLRRRILYSSILIDTGQLFSVRRYDATVSRFINMDIFKYVNINYEKSAKDSLDVKVLLTPALDRVFEADIEANTSSRSFLGTAISVGYGNKNLFYKAEKFSIKLSAGAEFQNVNKQTRLNILNASLELRQDLPFVLGNLWAKKIYTAQAPRTYFKINLSSQQWLQYYTLYGVNLAFGYEWQTKHRFNHTLEPVSLNRINILKITPEFEEILNGNPLLRASFDDINILGGNYNLSFRSKRREGQKSYFVYNFFTELNGNTTALYFKIFQANEPKPNEVFNVPFAQFGKGEVEVRHYFDISANSRFATRLNAGIGLAYGNSEVLPYVKQYFVGGPSTLRAFPYRSVGPGNYTSADENQKINPIEQSGDIKLLFNTEYRWTLYKFIKAAIFVDAGNVWLNKDDPARPTGEFKWNRFYEQIALGSGLGLRLDFNFFVLRFDVGVPLYVPYAIENQRWITHFPTSGFNDWQRKYAVYNLAIGYPF